MFNEKKLIEAIAISRLFDIRELACQKDFVSSENGQKQIAEYKEKVIDWAIIIAQLNKLSINETEIFLIVNKVFADVLEIEV